MHNYSKQTKGKGGINLVKKAVNSNKIKIKMLTSIT
jgi:hypothetical protein